MSCNICCEPFNRSSRKSIQCGNCPLVVCRECVIRNMKENPGDVICMGCQQLWTRQFLSQNMTKAFMSRDFKEHREEVLFDQQRAHMEATLPFVESTKRKRKLQSDLESLYTQLDELHTKIRRVNDNIDRETRFFNTGNRPGNNTGTEQEPERLFSRGHCIKDDCNGLIDNSWKCSTCETKVCQRCMKEREPDHLCLREDVESMRLIRQDSKPCPSCGVRIHIYEGCNQAWCTQCNTAFNWRTLKLIRSGFFHNPHFAEWQVRNGGSGLPVNNFRGNGANNQCVNFNDINRRVLTELANEHSNAELSLISRRFRGFLIAANQIMDTEVDRRDNEFVTKMRTLRTRFLMNELDEDEFRTHIQRVDKAHQKRGELASVMEMYGTVARETLSRWARSEEISIRECEETLNALYAYTKESVKNIHKWYQPFSRHTGYFVRNYYR